MLNILKIYFILIWCSQAFSQIRYDTATYDSDYYNIETILLHQHQLKSSWFPISIYGTFNNNKDVTEQIKNAFLNYTGNPVFLTTWTSNNSDLAREKGAVKITKQILSQFSNQQNLILFGHSHGGNVAILAINQLIEKYGFNPDKIILITVNTPVLSDYQLKKSVYKHIHFYNPYDIVQIRGGHDGDLTCSQNGGCARRIYATAGNLSYRDGKEDSYWKKVPGKKDPTTHYSPTDCSSRHCGFRDQNNLIWFAMLQTHLTEL